MDNNTTQNKGTESKGTESKFTQEDLDRILKERLAKESERHNKRIDEESKKWQEKLAALEEQANKGKEKETENQKLAKQLEELAKQMEEHKRALTKTKLDGVRQSAIAELVDNDIPKAKAEKLAKLLDISEKTDKESLDKQIKDLVEEFGELKKTKKQSIKAGTLPDDSVKVTDDQINKWFGL